MSADTMGDILYERKFNEMQKYIPFLERVIEKLKNNDHDKPRKAQLEKMQMLYNLLNNKQKKLKIETLLKCESVLKKLHAKIEKSDDLSPPLKTLKKPSTVTASTSNTSSTNKIQPNPFKLTSAHASSSPSSAVRSSVPKSSSLFEINTCPASPTQFGDEDFRPPVEIPTERRCSPPIRAGMNNHWEHHKPEQELGKPIPTVGSTVGSVRFPPNRAISNYYQNSNSKYQQNQPPQLERPKSNNIRWSDKPEWTPETPSDMPTSSSFSYDRTWTSSSSSASSISHRPHERPQSRSETKPLQRSQPQTNYSSEEENWDDPEDELPPPPPKLVPKPAPPLPPSSHRESSTSSHHHRHHERNSKHNRDFPPLPDIPLDKDAYQKKLYHDTIYKYKKPEPPTVIFNHFMNPPPPEPPASTQVSNIFNRLGDKVDKGFENFRIEVKNDKMKPKLPKPTPPPSLPLPVVPIKPIDEVLKSPPLSADDIDDLLNESLEAAVGKPVKSKPIEVAKDPKTNALELVRKKLAMISKAPPTGMESPPSTTAIDQEEKEPFYRRGHTPTKQPVEPVKRNSNLLSPQREHFKSTPTLVKNYSEHMPRSPPNPIDPVIERLALKYNPHRRRDSISAMSQENPTKYSPHQMKDIQDIQSPPIKDQTIDPMGERLAFKYNPHPRRDPPVTPLRTVDPRVGKMLGQLSPMVTSPIAVSPVPNILPAINPYDPRLRNSRLTSVDPIPVAPFCTPIPYAPPIPSLLDINIKNPLSVPGPKPTYGIQPPCRLDPRIQKQQSIYADKFNPERNDLTERMKYLESKKKKPPEPKTYGEYRQSKCRQQAVEEAAKAEEAAKTATLIDPIPAAPSILSTTPSTLDKMYRNADYGKELGASMHGFKIPKKPKPEEPKIEPKKDDEVSKSEESVKKFEETVKKSEEPAKNLNELLEKVEEPVKKIDEPMKKLKEAVKKPEEPVKIPEEPVKNPEGPVKKVETKKIFKEQDHLPINLKDSVKSTQIEVDTPKMSEPQPGNVLVIDNEEEDQTVEPILTRGRRTRGRPKVIKNETVSPERKKEEITPPSKLKIEAEEESEEEIKPRRIGTRRSTILKDSTKEEEKNWRSESSSPTLTRCRSASDLFAPTTDNSVVSTQNIISGKRKTRASINFNEKTTKKSATPKATPVSSPAAVTPVRGKPGPKSGAKKSPPVAVRATRRQTGGKKADDGQICAVSSTTSQGGDADESHNEDLTVADEIGSPEVPSSSGSKPPATTVDADENQKKQEWLEGFLQSIVDPSTNKDRILDMLKAVLDEKKLQQVKDILYSPEDGGRETLANVKKSQEQNKPRATRTKKNELDRLNEDIRDMFICQGVVTATGRRMCTLARDTSKEKTSAVKPKEQPKEKKTKLKGKSPSTTPSPAPTKRRMRRAKVMISPLNMRALRSRSQKKTRPREMPVLEPNTPIKLSGEEEDEEEEKGEEEEEDVELVRPPKKRPGPKSKRVPSLSLEMVSGVDDDDDDIQLVHLKKKMTGNEDEEVQEEKDVEKGVDKEVEKEKEAKKEEVEIDVNKKEVIRTKVDTLLPKNTNSEWHTMSDYATCCVICKEKARHIAPHYLTAHNDSEVYSSRLPPAVLKDLKQDIGNRALYWVPKKPNLTAFHYRCPFCDFQATSTLRGWLEHFTIHTGEYQYKCSGCFKAMNGCTHLVEHMKKVCPEATRITREPVNLRGHSIKAYVCHLCNFMQILRSGVVQHLKTHHNLEDDASIACITEVKLIDTAEVAKMEETPVAVESAQDILAPPPPPSASTNKPSSESNMDVFLSRELASPTSDVLTERLKSIDQDDGMTSDSSVNTVSPFKDGQASTTRMTIAERLSQRFKNIEKQNEDIVTQEDSTDPSQVEERLKETRESSTPMEIEEMVPAVLPPLESPISAVGGCPSVDSFNESGNLIIDEQEGDKSTVDDDGSDSEWANGNDEDDNENWEDIEITETKGTCPKDKNKNKSIFQTLSRLYASIAPKKGSKKSKEKENEKKKSDTPQPVQAPKQPSLSSAVPVAISAAAAPPPPPPPQISNLSDLLPDSPNDSLDILLATNFNCLEGDGTSFPHLDLNHLDSPLGFLLSEEQTNLQDAIAMATDLDQIKYDVLGNPLPPPQLQVSSSTSVQRIGNFGFSWSGESLKYYCMVTACTFLFSDHPDGLQNHFLLEHPMLRWNGHCHTCKAQVCPEGSREMQHMSEVHSKAKKIEQYPADKPRIKFRRLTGDILSTGKQLPPPAPPAPLKPPAPPTPPATLAPPATKEPDPIPTSELCLSTLLQSEPRAMTLPTPPPAFQPNIPLYKNVSKEFTITAVAEGVTDDDLRNLVLNQAESTPGGMQISQVISLNAGGKSLSPAPRTEIPNCNSALQLQEIPVQNKPQMSAQIILPGSGSTSQRSSPVPPKNPPPKLITFKCCATYCQYSTPLRSAMNEHLIFHLRTDNDRGALKCHECAYVGRNITDYFQHMSQGHTGSALTLPCPSTNELTQKIQDILRASANPSKTSEEDQQQQQKQLELNTMTFAERLRKVAEEMVVDTGMPESDVWICPLYPECTRPMIEKDFVAHAVTHMSATYSSRNPRTALQCPHCRISYTRPGILKAHIKTHGRHQYFCYQCCATFVNFHLAQRHYSEVHSRAHHAQVQALILDETPHKPPFLLVSLNKLSVMEVVQFGEKLLAEWERKKALTKTHFKPNEQYLLPIQPIFNNQVFCSVCNYKTKVRTNMYRHLQLHKQEVDVASVDPVNPVPCLEKNEKHFDKMLNLACSSNATGSAKPKETTGSVKVPSFVPDMRRYVCGHPGCTYLTITDQMLRSHLNALHSGEKGYQCPHCQEDICKKAMCAERIVQHLKFHGPKIYQCGECEYLHYTKHVVERHVHDKHNTVPFVNLISYDRTGGEVNKTTQLVVGKGANSSLSETESHQPTPASSTPPATKCKWECALCKHQTVTWNQMISHANSVHHAKHQYHCVHCTFGSAHLAHIMEHIDTKHPTKTREAKYVFYKINETAQDKAADTRPLWSRDDPKRVRSIRGILMENEEDAERTKQSLSKAGIDLDDEDDDVEIVQVIESESAMKPGVLGCFHCEYKSEDMPMLTSHWKTKHWQEKNHEFVPKVPFFFRIHSILKCPLCSYVGDYVFLQLHAFNKHGQRTFCAADPKLPNTCGHCPFVYPPKRLEILTRHYHREHKPTDVKNLSTSLLKSVLALGECQVYMQCYFCAEICADKAAIIEHERERHGSCNFRYKQIKDEVIYRCGMCQYSSTNELATLRHMIDHYGGFMHCHFCMEDQSNFNSYMQHCYTNHRDELKEFKHIYPLSDITAFLGQMLLIFPNGLIVNKRNLKHTQYGSTERICAMYNEICKKALEPPIAPLNMARLMAKKSIEAKELTPLKPLLPPPPVPVTAKRIAKRRSTVAMGAGDRGLNDFLIPSGSQKMRKRKASISEDRPEPATPLFSTITARVSSDDDTVLVSEYDASPAKQVAVGLSFYRKQPEPVDLSKIYTQIAIGDKFAPVSVKKFALLFRMNAKVVVDKMNFGECRPKKRSGIRNKPCPASKKKRL